MQRIFDDERHRNGGFARGPFEAGSKLTLNASKILAGSQHRLALFSCSRPILAANATNREIVTTT